MHDAKVLYTGYITCTYAGTSFSRNMSLFGVRRRVLTVSLGNVELTNTSRDEDHSSTLAICTYTYYT